MTFKQVLSYFLTGAAVLSVTTTTLAAEDLLHDNADGAADMQAQISHAEKVQTSYDLSKEGCFCFFSPKWKTRFLPADSRPRGS